MVERRLGRGLDFFLSGVKPAPAVPVVSAETAPAAEPEAVAGQEASATQLVDKFPREETILVTPDLLGPSPYQPRKQIAEAELQELAASIRASGILQPILVRRAGDRFEIVAGERRWRAAQLAGLERVPVLVRSITDEESAIFGLVENLQRADLNAIEKAKAFRLLQEKLTTTQEEIAKRVGLDRSSVANFLRLLDLPEEVQAHVSRGTLSMGHARALLGLVDRDSIVKLGEECIRQAWSVRSLEQEVKQLNEAVAAKPGSPAKPKSGQKNRPVWLRELEESLVESLSTKVAIRYSKKRSQIQIDCVGPEEFERIFQRLKNC